MIRSLFAAVLGLGALTATVLSCRLFGAGEVPAALAPVLGPDSATAALWLHGTSAVLAALAALTATRAAGLSSGITLFVLYALIAGSLPVIGLLCVAAIALMLGRPPRSSRLAEDRFAIGLPRLMSAEEQPPPILEPYATLIPKMEPAHLGPLLLGLRHVGGAPDFPELPILRRFQSDPNPELQFFAQGQLASAQDELETALERAQSAGRCLTVAELHLLLARRCPPGDVHTRRIHAQAALKTLEAGPSSPETNALRVQAALLLNDPAEARRWLSDSTDGPSARAAGETLLLEGRFSALRSHLSSLRQSPDSVLSEVASFWHSPAPSRP